MKVTFKEIGRHNDEECATLKVGDEQAEFISPNWESLLEVHYEVEGDRYPLAIYDGGKMIGFLMYVFYPADEDYPLDSWWVERFMIDKAYQGRGYGKASLKSFFSYFKSKFGDIELRIATDSANNPAIRLYEHMGFVKTGEIAAGEEVLHISLED